MNGPAVRRRQAAGTPVGGQFATETRAEPQVTLAAGRWATAAPMEIDKALDAELAEHERQSQHLEGLVTLAHVKSGDRRDRSWGQLGPWKMTDAEALAKIADLSTTSLVARDLIESYRRTAQDVADVQARIDEIDAEFTARGGWTRAFLVAGNDGHVHSSRQCSTCNRQGKATRFVLMHEWSGADAERIVADAGWRACTVCYPRAPVGDPATLPSAMRTDEERRAAEDRAARQTARDERAGRKLAKAATASGAALEVEYTVGHRGRPESEFFTTETAARSWYVEQEAMARHPRWQSAGPGTVEARKHILAALAHKHGVDVADLQAELEARVAAKVRGL